MRNYAVTLLSTALLCSFCVAPSQAGMEDLANEIVAKQKQIDPKYEAQPALIDLLQANCLLNSAFSSALKGEMGGIREALTGSSKNLRKAASLLRSLAKEGRYKNFITPRGLKLSSEAGSGRYADVRNANSLIFLISDLAEEAADSIGRISDSKASFNELTNAVALTGDINTLVIAFYSSQLG